MRQLHCQRRTDTVFTRLLMTCYCDSIPAHVTMETKWFVPVLNGPILGAHNSILDPLLKSYPGESLEMSMTFAAIDSLTLILDFTTTSLKKQSHSNFNICPSTIN